MRNIKLTIEYDGTNYAGWQRQPLAQGMTIQYQVEKVLTSLFREQIVINGAGRTDSGVHALGQVANFYCHKPVPVERIVEAANHKLPPDIRVRQAEEVPMHFHARYGAVSKRYRYLLEQETAASAFANRFSWELPQALDVAAMRQGAAYLLGEHDFFHYAASGVSAERFVRTVTGLEISQPQRTGGFFPWQRLQQPVTIDVTANGFLYHMVRLITCRLVAVGLGQLPPQAIQDFLEGRLRRNIRMAPARGLMLMEVTYS